MTKLFIIGNGFDLKHGLPTTYDHFREYLRTTYTYNWEEAPDSLVEPSTDQDGELIYDDDGTVHYIDTLISLSNDHDNWKDFESSLGHLDYSIVNDDIPEFFDKDGDVDPFRTGPNYESKYSDLINVVKKIPLYFRDWINMIPVSEHSYHYPLKVVKKMNGLFDCDEDIFITFNYTHTLENLYQVTNVLHIHGEQGSDKLIIGHGDVSRYEEEEVYFQDIYKNEMYDYLRKNTQECINQNSQFFEDILNLGITEIYTYGFSFGEVDWPYLIKIIENIDTTICTWYLHSNLKEEIEREREVDKFTNIIEDLGFNGRITTY